MATIQVSDTKREIKNKGDISLTISPFDNYHLITLFKSNQGDNSQPLDLSTTSSTYYLNFSNSDQTSEVSIAETKNVENIDKQQGQILFKISKENARKILVLDNNNYYITSKLPNGDENVVFFGTWADYETQSSLGSLSTQLSVEQSKVDSLQQSLDIANQTIADRDAQIQELQTLVDNLQSALKQYENLPITDAIDLETYLSKK